ncbi:MAG: NAD(P)/FAD-dependent oxidoreductase [Vampirovibrionia bacterium]
MNYLIIGNSAAAIGAVEGIRKVDNDSSITIVSEESYYAYSRPLIAEYLSDCIEENKIWYKEKEYYDEKNVNLLLNTKIISIDTHNKKALDSDNNEYYFDKMLIATGGTPFIPTIEGLETEGIYTFVRWDEVKKLKDDLSNIKKAVVIGAGLIGMKATEHLTKCGVNVILVELADSILNLVLDKTGSNILHKHLEKNGVEIITNNTVVKINSEDNKVQSVILKDQTLIDCDAVVIAIGVKPNTSCINNTDIATNRGIIINNKLETNYNYIYAAGDVAEGYNILTDNNTLLPIWPVAYRQGFIAGINMTGKERQYDGSISMNSLEFFGLPIISAGYTTIPDDSYNENYDLNEKKNVYKKVITKDNQLCGFVFINDIDRAGILTGLIKDKTDISTFEKDLLNDSFGLLNIPKEIVDIKVEKALSVSI